MNSKQTRRHWVATHTKICATCEKKFIEYHFNKEDHAGIIGYAKGYSTCQDCLTDPGKDKSYSSILR